MFISATDDNHFKFNRLMENDLYNWQLNHEGVRINDVVRISPVYGRSYTLELKRTRYQIVTEGGEVNSRTSFTQIVLPRSRAESFKFELSLFRGSEFSGREGQTRFLLKSLDGSPFIVNYQIVYSAFIERGDRVQIGQNILKFTTPSDENSCFQRAKILSNKKLMKSDIPILITGETGTGKTYLAKEIHQESLRRGAFVHINLSSYAPQLIESELFGHIKGAFTGALSNKDGAFKQAKYGTLFLDEVDSLSLDIQTKLLLFLDDKKIRTVGSQHEEIIDTRLVFASGCDLKGLVEKAKMRKDFYFRLCSGEQVGLLPLREDASLLESFINFYSKTNDINISTKLLDFYLSLPWPGNLRELRGHLDKKRILSANGKIDFDEYDERLIAQSSLLDSFIEGPRSFRELEQVKREHCLKVYMHYNQCLAVSARALNISTRALRIIISG